MCEATAKPSETIYQIRLQGYLDERWATWFAGLALSWDGDETILTGPVVDQAALFGLLRKIRDLGLPLRSVKQLPND